MGLILLILLLLVLMGSLPTYGYSREWGYRPAGGLGLLLVVLLILVIVGTVPWGFAPRPVYVAQPRPVVVETPPAPRVPSP